MTYDLDLGAPYVVNQNVLTTLSSRRVPVWTILVGGSKIYTVVRAKFPDHWKMKSKGMVSNLPLFILLP